MFNSTESLSQHSRQAPALSVSSLLCHPPSEVHRSTPEVPWTYHLLDQRQLEIAEALHAGDLGAGRVILSELSPVVTYGRRTALGDFRVDPEGFARLGIECVPVNRGGFATYHGPGQWVLFVVDRLEAMTGDRRGVRKCVDGLLEIALQACRETLCDLGLIEKANRIQVREGAELGVWTDQGKIASVGIHIQHGVVLHGVALNVFPTPQSFFGIKPCGLDAQVDFLFKDGFGDDRDGEFMNVSERLLRATYRQFWGGAENAVDLLRP